MKGQVHFLAFRCNRLERAGLYGMMQPLKAKNLTRYSYERTAFQGWRVSICRRQRQFTRYFSDREFGGEEAAFTAALQLRDLIISELEQAPTEVESIFARHR